METVADIRKLPGLGDDIIHIWGVHVPGMKDQLTALHAVLSAKEQEKAARFQREADRQSSIAARGALRILLSGYTGARAADIKFNYSENGKPHLVLPVSSQTAVSQASRLPGGSVGGGSAEEGRRDACHTVSFNVSHSSDWVVLAFGRNRRIGVDVEKIKWELDASAIATRYFSAEEQELINNSDDKHTSFFQLWARKEAYVKACGSTLFSELGSFSVPLVDGQLPDIGEADGWFFHRMEAGSKYAAAVVTDRPTARIPCYDFGGLMWDS